MKKENKLKKIFLKEKEKNQLICEKPKTIPLIFIPIFAGICRGIYVYYLIKPKHFFKTIGFVFLETFILVAIPMYIIILLNKRLRKVWKDEEKSSSENKENERNKKK